MTDERKKIEDSGIEHAVIFTTHATLMDHGLEGFGGWHARIDEAPAATQAGRFNIGLMNRRDLKDRFELISRPGDDWSVVRSKLPKPNFKEVAGDVAASQIGEFFKQAGQPDRVFVKAQSWDQTDDIKWFSMWTPLSLKHVASVQVAGSSYTKSIGYLTAKALYADILDATEREIAHRRAPSSLTSRSTTSRAAMRAPRPTGRATRGCARWRRWKITLSPTFLRTPSGRAMTSLRR